MRHELDINRIEQQTTNWCWAACAQMVIGFTNRNFLNQNQIVAVMYDVPVSAVSPDNPDCNRGATTHEIDTVLDEFSVSFQFLHGVLRYDELIAQLNSGPVILGIKWAGEGMHAVLGYGYNTNGKSLQQVLIRDPWKDTAPTVTVDYRDLIDGRYGGRSAGQWIQTYCKLKKTGT